MWTHEYKYWYICRGAGQVDCSREQHNDNFIHNKNRFWQDLSKPKLEGASLNLPKTELKTLWRKLKFITQENTQTKKANTKKDEESREEILRWEIFYKSQSLQVDF